MTETAAQTTAGPEPLSKTYLPAQTEPRSWKRWMDAGAFHADPNRVLRGEADPYCILIPPPNVTAALHLGHALNNTIQDILIRAHRMKGFETLWMPGTDHAGIATQTIVDKRLKEAGEPALADYKKMQLAGEDGQTKFVAKVQAFKDEYEQRITEQLMAMGCSCDWDRQRFTMDDVCKPAVREAFFQLFKDGLIYRGKRLVNWDPVTQTALSDDEVENHEVQGAFYYLRYPLVLPNGDNDHRPVTWDELAARGYPDADQHPEDEQAWVTVATTRPETYLGDTAVALNKRDPRAESLRGMLCELPLVGRCVPIIEDDYVVLPIKYGGDENDPKAQMATGFLKVTPAHDPNDYELGMRHAEDIRARCTAGEHLINIMAPDASISKDHGWVDFEQYGHDSGAEVFIGLSREDARAKVVEEFKARSIGEGSLLEAVKPHTHTVGHSYRSHAAIEPYLSDQWYCRVTDDKLRGNAQRATKMEQRSEKSLGAWPESVPSCRTGVPPVSGNGPTLDISERHLPHWELGGSTYFLTFRLADGMMSQTEQALVLDSCLHWHHDRAIIRLVTVMPDHVHLILTPLEKEPGTWWALADLLHSVKSFTAHEINKGRNSTGQVWQDESFDRIIRNEEEFRDTWSYMLHNPVKAGLCKDYNQYPFTRTGGPAEQGERHDRRDACPTRTQDSNPHDGKLTFFPDRYAKTYETWHDNLRDWCISRQLWWGHRIPVWTIVYNFDESQTPGSITDTEGIREYIANDRLEREQATRGALAHYLESAQVGQDEFVLVSIDDLHGYVCCRTDRAYSAMAAFEEFSNSSGYTRAPFPTSLRSPPGFESSSHEASLLKRSIDKFEQDPDVLDTWFSSALWPLSTMGWPNAQAAAKATQIEDFPELLQAFNPTSVLTTAREIITLWVSRMVMFNRYFLASDSRRTGVPPVSGSCGTGVPPVSTPTLEQRPDRRDACPTAGQLPFRDVFIHAMIQDGEGRKMSKSLGNGVDPLDIISSHGADAMRFTLCQMTTQTQDVRMPVEFDESTGKNTSPKFDVGRNFCNKLWNAARFTLMMLEDHTPTPGLPIALADLSLTDRWMLSRLAATTDAIDAALKSYQFKDYADALYDLLWRDFCDWYLEAIKPTLSTDPNQPAVLRAVFDGILRLLHPVAPFITEDIFERLAAIPSREIEGLTHATTKSTTTLCESGWPLTDPGLRDEVAEAGFTRAKALVTIIREVRAKSRVQPRRKITLHANDALAADFARWTPLIETLAGVETCTTEPAEGLSSAFTFEGVEHHLSNLADALDAGAEKERLAKRLAELDKSIRALEGRLNNPGYTERAPAKLVDQTRQQLADLQAERGTVAEAMGKL